MNERVRPAPAARPKSEGEVAGLSDQHSDIFFAAVQTTRMPMLVTDPRQPDNPIVFANAAFEAMTGYTHDEVLGSNCRFLQGPGTDPASVEQIRDAIARQKEVAVELLNYRKDGTTFWNALFVSPIFNQAGELVLFFSSQLDVTRRHDAEESLAQARRLEALGHLTGGIAHDFNNLLQIIVGHLDMVDLQLKRKDDDVQTMQTGIHRARSAAERASALTQQLLMFARQQSLSARVVNLSALTLGLAELARGSLGEAFDVQFDCAEGLPQVEVDATQYEVAVLNLLVNARDAMPEGGRIVVSCGEHTVDAPGSFAAHGLRAGRYAYVEVADTGEGIPPDVLPRVLDPFFTTKGKAGGNGLGLSTVYGFARQSGGTVQVTSKVGEGTHVRVFFPASQKSVVRQRPPAPAASPRGGDEHIVVVDDRMDVAEMTASMLTSLGYRVQIAHSGAEALGILQSATGDDRPALLLSDIVMPGNLDGHALARAASRIRPDMAILLVTGFDSDAQAQKLAKNAGTYVLRKPYRLEELARVVRMLIDGATGTTLPGEASAGAAKA